MKNVLFILLALFLTACSQQQEEPIPLTEHGEIAKRYLEDKGYKVLSYEGERTMVFTRSDLTKSPHKEFWAVQDTEPDLYLDKKLLLVKFLIKHHPLDDEFHEGKTSVTVMMWNQEIIGGTSFPYSKKYDLVGGESSLDGRTFEEVHGDWETWSQEWDNEYKEK